MIDDNEDLCESIRALLGYFGCRVELAYNGYEGMLKAIRERPDLIFVDIGLPGLSGYEVARVLRSSMGPGMVLVAHTALSSPEVRRRLREVGFDEHFVKPADPRELLKYVVGPAVREGVEV